MLLHCYFRYFSFIEHFTFFSVIDYVKIILYLQAFITDSFKSEKDQNDGC